MRAKIVAGNWKMNKTMSESTTLVNELIEALNGVELVNTEVIVAPTFVNLQACQLLAEKSPISIAAQNMHQKISGAYTGEISAPMLSDIGVKHVILGHSERREYFGESDALLAEKVKTALDSKLVPIFCFGEVLEERKSGKHFEVVSEQITKALFDLDKESWKDIILAYEPVWAIGTGETASPEQAQEIHAHVRKLIADKYDADMADEVSILYGGSVKPANAKEIFSQTDVDGGLIGGAALKADDFTAIVKAI
jgi:triosephosphate isomerase